MSSLKELTQKEVTRKEFLVILGFGLASILGFSTIFELLRGKHPHSPAGTTGYGSQVYGGGVEDAPSK